MKKKLSVIAIFVLTMLVAVFSLASCTNAPKVKVINHILTDEDYAFAIKKGDDAMLTAANALLTELEAAGTIDALVEKYSNGSEDQYVTYQNPTATPNLETQLVVVTNAEFTPFEFKVGDQFTGVDIEIAIKLAEKLNKPLFIKDGRFDAVVNEVNSGLAHIGMAGLTITDERKESVQFSTPYYKASQMIIALESDTTFDACTTAEEIFAIINNFATTVKIGYQNGTTGEFFTTTDYFEDGSVVFNGEKKGYDNGALAVKDLQNGNLDYVIIDQLPAKKIVEQMNKNAK